MSDSVYLLPQEIKEKQMHVSTGEADEVEYVPAAEVKRLRELVSDLESRISYSYHDQQPCSLDDLLANARKEADRE